MTEAYNPETDLVFFENPKYESFVVLEAGDCVVVAPEEAHKPKGQAGEPARVRKIVVKVRA